MDLLTLEEGVGHAQAMEAAELQQALTVLVDLPTSVSTKAGGPSLPISSNSGVEVPEEVECFSIWNPGYHSIQCLIKLVFLLRG